MVKCRVCKTSLKYYEIDKMCVKCLWSTVTNIEIDLSSSEQDKESRQVFWGDLFNLQKRIDVLKELYPNDGKILENLKVLNEIVTKLMESTFD